MVKKRKKTTKSKNNVWKIYKESWKFIKGTKNYIYFMVLMFIVALIVGVIFPNIFDERIMEYLRDLLGQIEGFGFFQLLMFILKNNILNSFFGIFLGVFFGIFPLIIVLANGYVVGFVTQKTAEVAGYGTLLRLVPHGIFELPAIFISLGIGLRLGLTLFKKKEKKKFNSNIKKSFKVFLFVVVPLLIIAGIIETALIFAIP